MDRITGDARKLHCIALGQDGAWEAICLDLDLAVQGRSFEEVAALLNEAIAMHLERAMTLPPEERGHLLHQPVPLPTRLRFAVQAFLLALAKDGSRGYQHHYTMPCPA
jgi:hypothetical protein